MKIIRSVQDMQAWAIHTRSLGLSIGFVPTMGALHQGHVSLVEKARKSNDRVVVSIFVNPTQFGPQEDFTKYPRTLAEDIKRVNRLSDFIFVPNVSDMYRARPTVQVSAPELGSILEGKTRPGHFTGVATVVAKLFNIVRPTRAYFGEKDFQQVRVIQRLIEDLNFPVKLVACPTVRERDGLACSSRNRYLSRAEREEAVKIYQALFLGRELISGRIMSRPDQVIRRLGQIFSKIPKAKVDYLALVDPETLQPMKKLQRPALLAAAVWIGKTRLIDNIIIP